MRKYCISSSRSSKIVLPKEIMKKAGMNRGSKVEVEVGEGIVILKCILHVIENLYGKFEGEDFLKELEFEHKREIEGEKIHS